MIETQWTNCVVCIAYGVEDSVCYMSVGYAYVTVAILTYALLLFAMISLEL